MLLWLWKNLAFIQIRYRQNSLHCALHTWVLEPISWLATRICLVEIKLNINYVMYYISRKNHRHTNMNPHQTRCPEHNWWLGKKNFFCFYSLLISPPHKITPGNSVSLYFLLSSATKFPKMSLLLSQLSLPLLCPCAYVRGAGTSCPLPYHMSLKRITCTDFVIANILNNNEHVYSCLKQLWSRRLRVI